MNDEQLTELIRSLPQQQASPGFTSEVLRRIERRPLRAWYRFAAAAAVAMVISGGIIGEQILEHRRAGRMEALRAEHDRIERELAELKQRSRELDTVIPIARADGVEYVVDLRSPSGPGPAVQQASYTVIYD